MIGLYKDIMIRVRSHIWLLIHFTCMCSETVICQFSGISECHASIEALSAAVLFLLCFSFLGPLCIKRCTCFRHELPISS